MARQMDQLRKEIDQELEDHFRIKKWIKGINDLSKKHVWYGGQFTKMDYYEAQHMGFGDDFASYFQHKRGDDEQGENRFFEWMDSFLCDACMEFSCRGDCQSRRCYQCDEEEENCKCEFICDDDYDWRVVVGDR